MTLLRRLTVLQNEAANAPVRAQRYFHIGQPEAIEGVGECIPMIVLSDDNLSRYVVSDAASVRWGEHGVLLRPLPNLDVRAGDGLFLLGGSGADRSEPHPAGKGRMHFVHLALDRPFAQRGLSKLYVYRLEGVQVHGLKGAPLETP